MTTSKALVTAATRERSGLPAPLAHALIVLAFAAAALFLFTGVTEAAFPGANGKIVFQSRRLASEELFVMNADGSEVEPLGVGLGSIQAHWSPDGSKIAYLSVPGGGLFLANEDGTGATRLTGKAGDANPHWSPDAAKILFDSDRDGDGRELYVVNSDGTGLTRLTFDGGGLASFNTAPSWSPDGAMIVFSHGTSVAAMNADGSGVTILAAKARTSGSSRGATASRTSRPGRPTATGSCSPASVRPSSTRSTR
jgi:Tol biopolymer transport system component